MNVESRWKKHNLHIAKPLQTRFQQSSIFLNCENKCHISTCTLKPKIIKSTYHGIWRHVFLFTKTNKSTNKINRNALQANKHTTSAFVNAVADAYSTNMSHNKSLRIGFETRVTQQRSIVCIGQVFYVF